MVVPLFLPMTGQTSSFHIECVSIRMEYPRWGKEWGDFIVQSTAIMRQYLQLHIKTQRTKETCGASVQMSPFSLK